MQNETVSREEHAPINWLTTTVFTVTPLAALTLVPWYGFTHRAFSAQWGAWAACTSHRSSSGRPSKMLSMTRNTCATGLPRPAS